MNYYTDNAASEASQLLEKFTAQEKKMRDASVEISETNRFVICFGGKFKTGKSSLINALLGVDLLPTKATTATTVMIRIVRGDNFCVWHRQNNRIIPVSYDEAQKIILNQRSFSEIIFELPVPWLPPYVEIRDTPGTEDDMLLENIADAAVRDVDLYICTYDASAMLSESERSRTAQLNQQLGGNLVFVINKTNLLNTVDDVKVVEKVAANFIKTMEYSTEETGKHFVVCSKPGLIFLNGFDEWLKSLIQQENLSNLNHLKAISDERHLQRMLNEHHAEALIKLSEVETNLENIETEHNNKLKAEKDDLKKKARMTEKKILKKEHEIFSAFTDLSDLEAMIKECAAGDEWEKTYSAETKEKTRLYFYQKFEQLQNTDEFADALPSLDFIDASLFDEFPEATFVKVKASGKDVAIGAGILGGIGLVFGPVGGAVGGALGAYLFGGETEKNISVETTMVFVSNTIIPKMKENFSEAIIKTANDKALSILSEQDNLKSGYETTIDQLYSAKNILSTYLHM